jgi:hypothetical protein
VKLSATGRLSLLGAPSVDADNEPNKDPLVKIVDTTVDALTNKCLFHGHVHGSSESMIAQWVSGDALICFGLGWRDGMS